MNDNDLERQLRAQAGPREQGYVPARLPASPAEAGSRRPSPLLRAAVLVPAAAAGILAVAVAGAILSGSGPTNIGADSSSSSTPVPSLVGGIRVCGNDDLSISAEPWGGAAGSRGTILSVGLADGRSTCALIPTEIAAHMSDTNGNVLITSDVRHAMSRDVMVVTAGDVHSYSVVWSNWCGDEPPGPVTLSVSAEEGSAWKDVAVPTSGADPVPPCLGDNAPSNLSVTQLAGAQ